MTNLVLICCFNCIYLEKNELDLDKPIYYCLKNPNKAINNRYIDMCVKFKKG